MPVVNNIKRRIRGFSHENRCRLPIPTILDFELLVKYMQTLIEKKILSEGSVVPWSENRYLVRATSNNIDVLNSNGNWFIGPDNSYQVYTVHHFVDLCVYALLPKASRHIKCTLLQSKIWSESTSFCYDRFWNGFEKLRREHFPETEIKGSFFLFSQAIYRKILEFGYPAQYREDKDFNSSVRLLTALAFAAPLHGEEWYKIVIKSRSHRTSKLLWGKPERLTEEGHVPET